MHLTTNQSHTLSSASTPATWRTAARATASFLFIATTASAGSPCGTGGSCFEPQGQPGCSDVTCCETVCSADPFCCTTSWDANCAALAGIFCEATTVIECFGLEHTLTGSAEGLCGRGSLTLSGLGAGGDDGVDIDLGGLTSRFGFTMTIPNGGSLPAGAELSIDVKGQLNGQGVSLAVHHLSAAGDGSVHMTSDLSAPYSVAAYVLFSGKTVVAEIPATESTPVTFGTWPSSITPGVALNLGDRFIDGFLAFDRPTAVSIGGGSPMMADGVAVLSTKSSTSGALAAEQVSLRGTNLNSIIFTAMEHDSFQGSAGEAHNAGLDYLVENAPPLAPTRITVDEYVQQAELAEPTLAALGLDSGCLSATIGHIDEQLGDLGLSYVDDGVAYVGAPVPSDEVVPYVTARLRDTFHLVSPALADAVNQVNQMAIAGAAPEDILKFVVNEVPAAADGALDERMAALFVNVFQHSYDFWSNATSDSQITESDGKTMVNDAIGAWDGCEIGFALGGPWGAVIGGVIVGLASSWASSNSVINSSGSTTLPFGDLSHVAIGNAFLDISSGTLIAGSFAGDLNGDGVGVAFPAFTDVSWSVQPNFDGAAIGSSFDFGVNGELNGQADQPIFSISHVSTDEGMLLQPDFGNAGSSTYSMTLYQGSQVVYQQSGMSGPAGMLLVSHSLPGSGGCTYLPPHSPILSCYYWPFPDPKFPFGAAFAINGGETFAVTQFLFSADAPTANVTSYTGFTAVGTGLDSISITSVSVPPACPADLDANGDVGAPDLAILLGAWGSSGSGDINSDGIVDSTDLALLLGAWGGCS
jgi:hypothetical protein